jgi:hypothetical protein
MDAGLTLADNLGKAEIHQLDVPPSIKQDVFGLQVPVHNAMFMQENQNQGDLGGVKLGCSKVESTCSSQIAEYFPTL